MPGDLLINTNWLVVGKMIKYRKANLIIFGPEKLVDSSLCKLFILIENGMGCLSLRIQDVWECDQRGGGLWW